MESWRHSYYNSHNDWDFHNGNNGGSRVDKRSSSSALHQSSMYNQQQSENLYQTKYPQEWKNFKLKDVKRKKARRDRSAVNPLVKHFLFAVNVLFLVAGAAITSMSVYVLVESDDEENDISCFLDFIFSPACLLCTLGGLVVVPAFLGCYGALRENTFIIKMYFIFTIFLLIIEIVLITGLFIFTFEPEAFATIGLYPEDVLEEAIIKYGDRVYSEGSCGKDGDDYLDLIQDKFSCCGSSNDDNGYLDWERNPYYGCNSTGPQACSVPISCCKADTTTFDCGVNKLNPSTTDLSGIYLRGCEKGMREVFGDNIVVIAICSCGGLLLQIFFTCCAIRLNSQVMEQRSKW